MFVIIGIYKYTNKINGKVYIGKSTNIENRRYKHKSSTKCKNNSGYNTPLHYDMRKYGIDNFDFEILVELSPSEYTEEKLNELEQYFIKYYNSFKNGYNATKGGENNEGRTQKGETNGRALLTKEDVKYIRECYNTHIPFRQVYSEFQNRMSRRGLQKIWYFENWKDIFPEYNTEANKTWHKKYSSQGKFSDTEIIQMRKDYINGVSVEQIWLKYAPNCTKETIRKIVTYKTYKDIK